MREQTLILGQDFRPILSHNQPKRTEHDQMGKLHPNDRRRMERESLRAKNQNNGESAVFDTMCVSR